MAGRYIRGSSRFSSKYCELVALVLISVVSLWSYRHSSRALFPEGNEGTSKTSRYSGTENDVAATLAYLEMSRRRDTSSAGNSLSFEEKLIARFDPELRPVWNCTTEAIEARHTKIIFVHVFKTAGSTMRRILGSYARACHAGFSILASCSNLDYQLVNSTHARWEAPDGGLCRQILAMDRNQQRIPLKTDRSINNEFLREHVDLLAGHLPIGIHEYWNHEAHAQPMYITFFREPVAKFVSGVIYVRKDEKNLSYDDIVRTIRDRVSADLDRNEYRHGYTKYLLTPSQKRSLPMSSEDQVQMILSNIVDMPTVVGIVERMKESMELLAHILDGNHEHHDELLNAQETTQENKGVISTSEVIRQLQQDPVFFAKLEEYLKYDKMVYEVACRLHQLQYTSLIANSPTRSSVEG